MRPAVRQRQPQQERVHAQHPLESVHDWDAPPLPDQGHLLPGQCPAQRTLGSLPPNRVRITNVRFPAVSPVDFKRHPLRTFPSQMLLHGLQNARRLLRRHQTEGQLCKGGTRDHRFGAFPLKTAANPVEFGRRPAPNAFQGREPGLPADGPRPSDRLNLRLSKGHLGPGRPLPVRQREYPLVKPIHSNGPGDVVQARNQTRQNHRRITHRPPVNARVQVRRRPVHPQFHRRNSPQTIRQRRYTSRHHSSVGNRNHITLQLLAVRLQKGLQVVATDLLLPLDQKNQVHRQVPLLPQRGGNALHMGENLALVVGGASGEKYAIADLGIERRRGPSREGFLRLDVVVAVDQNRRAAGLVRIAGDDHGVARSRQDLGGKPNALKMSCQPSGAGRNIRFAGRIGGNAGKANEITEESK